jgi:hypothetical protein
MIIYLNNLLIKKYDLLFVYKTISSYYFSNVYFINSNTNFREMIYFSDQELTHEVFRLNFLLDMNSDFQEIKVNNVYLEIKDYLFAFNNVKYLTNKTKKEIINRMSAKERLKLI